MRQPFTAPGPRGRQTAHVIAGFATDPLKQYRKLGLYGDAVEFAYAPRRRFFVFSRPEFVEHILVRNQDNYIKAYTYRPLRIFLGDGLVTSEGDIWRRHRRIVQPVFARRHIAALAPAMVAGVERALDAWRPGSVLPVRPAMSALTLDVVGRALFGSDLTGETARLSHSIGRMQSAVLLAGFVPGLWSDPGIRRIRALTGGFGGMLEAVDRPVNAMIARHRERGAEDGGENEARDLLDLLIAARDEDGSALTDGEIRDEVATFMLAGHETTAVALSWALALLSAHPQDRERLEEEVDSVLGGRTPGPDDVEKLPWTAAVISEVMRLYPPAWTIERDAAEADEIGGVRIPAGGTVAVPPFLVHRHPGTWDNPEGFDPRRFMNGSDGGRHSKAAPDDHPARHRLAYIPFGAGRRGCVGAGFAQLEATIVLASIVQRYRLDLVGTFPATRALVTLRPAGRLPMRLTRR